VCEGDDFVNTESLLEAVLQLEAEIAAGGQQPTVAPTQATARSAAVPTIAPPVAATTVGTSGATQNGGLRSNTWLSIIIFFWE